MIKTILWDIDGTVLDFLYAERKSLRECFDHFGLGECTDEMIDTYSNINNKYWEMLEREELTKSEVLVNRYVEFLDVYGINGVKAEDINERYENGLPNYIQFIGDAFDVIKKLSREYKQYAVTNGALSVQTRKLRESGLNDYLDGAFISDAVGYEKPSMKFFDTVLNNIEPCEKDEILIIGDSLTSDMQGGNNAGIKCCWFNPSHKELSKPLKIDHQIDNVNQIFDVLSQIK